MSLLFNQLFRLVKVFLPRSKHLLISWLQSPSAVILEPRKIKSLTVSIVSPSTCHEVMGPDAMIIVFWMLSFKPTFSLSTFTFLKRLFSSPSLSAITSWQIEGEKVEVVTDFLFLGSKITVDNDGNHEIKRHLLLGRKAMTNLDSVLERRDIILPTRIQIVKTMTFLVVTYGCELDHKEGWALKNWCFQTMALEKTLESPLGTKELKTSQP